jgi:hypothetical protein
VAFREVRVNDVSEVLRAWLCGDGLRTAAERAGVDRKTARRYVEAGQATGLVRDGGVGQLCDELIGAVIAAVRPARASGHVAAWESLLGHERRVRLTRTGEPMNIIMLLIWSLGRGNPVVPSRWQATGYQSILARAPGGRDEHHDVHEVGADSAFLLAFLVRVSSMDRPLGDPVGELAFHRFGPPKGLVSQAPCGTDPICSCVERLVPDLRRRPSHCLAPTDCRPDSMPSRP